MSPYKINDHALLENETTPDPEKIKISNRVFSTFGMDAYLDMVDSDTMAYRRFMSFYKCAAMQVETKFNVLSVELALQNEHNPIESIKTRIKTPESIVSKMNRRQIPLSIDEIEKNLFDIAGIRVITSLPEDIYFLEDCLLSQDDVRLIERKDYIEHPKANGYRSLHLIIEVPIFLQEEKRFVKVEVQLRTIAMEFWASIEHKMRYKKNLPEKLQRSLAWSLYECANESARLDLKMQDIRRQIETYSDSDPE